jgi:tRNA(Ile)-lysidine synthase
MPQALRVAVAASGGRDSTALLHCTAHAAAALGVEVHALHVNHGLQPAADAWQAQVAAQCRRWARTGLPLRVHTRRLDDAPARGESVEAWARRGRYAALSAMAHEAGCTLVLLAHHRRDQAETLLLQALRGGGAAGLAAMPRLAEREGLTWARPWLDLPRRAIEAYVHRHRLRFVDDASNADPRHARNRLRLQVWPALESAFADAETALAGAAKRAQEDAACLSECATADLAGMVEHGALKVGQWRLLSMARRRLVLRAWLASVTGDAVPDSLVQRLATELPQSCSARWPAPGGELRLHDARVVFEASPSVAPRRAAAAGPLLLDLSRSGRHPVPAWAGAFVVEPVRRGGIAVDELRHARLRTRQGGEQFQRGEHGLPRSLKKQFQAARVPAWGRDGPLLYAGQRLLFVPGLGVDGRAVAAPGAAQSRVVWVSDPTGATDRDPPAS